MKSSGTSAEFSKLFQLASFRSSMYCLLANGFLDPTVELASGIVNRTFQSDIAETVKGLTECYHHDGCSLPELILSTDNMLKEVFLQDQEILYHRLAVEYARLFIGPGSVVVSPYESIHETDETHPPALLMVGPVADKVLISYQEAGLTMIEGLNEPPDHIATELEFMYYLSNMEAIAWNSGEANEARKWHGLQLSFFKSHLGGWGINFTRLVEKETTEKFYSALSSLAFSFFQIENNIN